MLMSLARSLEKKFFFKKSNITDKIITDWIEFWLVLSGLLRIHTNPNPAENTVFQFSHIRAALEGYREEQEKMPQKFVFFVTFCI